MQVLWFIPTHGDGRYLGTRQGGRSMTLDYLQQIAQAVDSLGYTGALLPTGRSCEDAWIVAASLIAVTKKMKFLVAIRPGIISPTLSARMTATFDRLSQGRLIINVVTGGDPLELAGDGVHLSHDGRYELTNEFLTVWRQITAGEVANFQGEHLDIKNGKIVFPLVQQPHPPLWFGGSSPAAMDVAAKHIDVYLTWGEPPQQVSEKIQKMRELAAAQGRTIRFGIRLHVIVRETESEAWDAANNLIKYLDEDTIAAAQKALANADSEGQRRMVQLHQGGSKDKDQLEISPNLWAGIGLVRGGAGTALVGSVQQVVDRMLEYYKLGIETFIFSGYPHLEEAYRVAELLLPELPLESPVVNTPSPVFSPIGEIIGNQSFPQPKVENLTTAS